MLKKAAAAGLAGLVLGVSPAAADSMSDGTTVALTMIGGGGLMSIGCMATVLLTQDDEDDQEGYDRRGFYAAAGLTYARENFTDSTVINLFDGELNDNLQTLRGTPNNNDPGNYKLGIDDIDEDAFGFAGRVGYRCHPYVSVELQSEWLDNFDGRIAETDMPMNDIPRKFDLELESIVFTTNVKGHLLTGRYQPFVLMGLGFMRMESKARDTTPDAAARRAVCLSQPFPDPDDPCFTADVRERIVRVAARFGGGLDYYLTDHAVLSAEASYLMPTGKLDGMDYYTFGIGFQYRF